MELRLFDNGISTIIFEVKAYLIGKNIQVLIGEVIENLFIRLALYLVVRLTFLYIDRNNLCLL